MLGARHGARAGTRSRSKQVPNGEYRGDFRRAGRRRGKGPKASLKVYARRAAPAWTSPPSDANASLIAIAMTLRAPIAAILLAAAAFAAAPVLLPAHPGHHHHFHPDEPHDCLPIMATVALWASADGADEEMRMLDHHMRLFARSAHPRPTRALGTALEGAEDIFAGLHAWRPAPLTDDETAALARRTAERYAALRAEYPVAKARWDGRAWSFEGPDGGLAMASGLFRDVLVEARNDSASAIDITASIDGARPEAASIPPGAMLPLLVEARPPRSAGHGHLHLMVAGPAGAMGMGEIDVDVEEPSVLRGRALDSATGEPFPARITAVGSDGIIRHGAEFAANETLSVKTVPFRPVMFLLPFSYTSGEFEFVLPPGTATLSIERGFESPIATESVELEPGGEASADIATGRAIDMKALGWISGDTHIHWVENSWDVNEDIELLGIVQRAEDLRVANNLTLYQWRDDAMGGPFTKPDQYPMGPVPGMCCAEFHIEMAEEFRNDNHYGHLNLLNLEELVTPVATGPGSGGPPTAIDWPQNKWVIEQARAQGGISVEAHGLGPFHASGVAVNVLNGYSDSLDQLEPAHYYRFLDAGVRIGLSNGSDHPARVVGVCRVYVHSGAGLDYDAWCDALAAGRTFTTSGPLLFLEVHADGGDPALPGDILDAEPGDTLRVTARAWSRRPIGNLQIVGPGGRILAQATTDEHEAEIAFEHTVDGPAWFAARCAPGDDFNALNGPDIAHTSAAHIAVDGLGMSDPNAGRFWMSNIQIHRQRLLATGNFENDEQRQEALAWIDKALARAMEIAGEQ